MKFWYRAEALAAADRHRLDGDLVIAMAMHESNGGHHHAYRYEPAFWTRYLANKPEWRDAVPERVSASYGLLQVMFTTALQYGYPKNDPPERLFEPAVNLEWGCRVLAARFAWAKGDRAAALAAYNGGPTADNAPGVQPKRNHAYVTLVQHWFERVQSGEVTG